MHESRQRRGILLFNSSGTTLKQSLSARIHGLRLCCLFLLVVTIGAAGCSATHALVARETAELGATTAPITWYGPTDERETATLARWRRAVGPPLVALRSSSFPTRHDEITVVSWNVALGLGDVVGMVRATGADRGPLVLLLQEAFRAGPEVPRAIGRDDVYAGHLAAADAGPRAREVEAIAAELGLSAYYVPSMRNGAPSAYDEDRGNAILTNLPLSDLAAAELPFEHQRRVALAATLSGATSEGTPWRLRVVSAHLDNLASARHWWIGGEFGRARQARGLVSLVQDDVPTVLAGDFNTWFGAREAAYTETRRLFPDTKMLDTRATFRGLLRLDHVFLRLGRGWRASFRRGDDRFGSDHHPLVGTIRFR